MGWSPYLCPALLALPGKFPPSSLRLHPILFPFSCYGMHPLRWLRWSPPSASHDFCNYILWLHFFNYKVHRAWVGFLCSLLMRRGQSWKNVLLLRETQWLKPPTVVTIVTIYLSYFTTAGPGKEHGTNKPLPTRSIWERSKGDTTCPTTSQNPFHWHPSWLSNMCTTRKDPKSELLARDNPKTNPITIKP